MLRFGTLSMALLGIAALGLAAVGCGGDDDDDDGGAPGAGGGGSGGSGSGAAPFEAGVSGEKPVGELTGDEAQQLCTAYDSYVSARFTPDVMKKYACNLQAGLTVQSGAECAAKVSECLQQPPVDMGAPFDGEGLTCEADATARSGCTATVDEFGACAVAMLDQALVLLGSLTCESIAASAQGGNPPPGAEAPALPAACQVIEQKCPGFMSDEATGE